jgi:hypothetical protein
VGRGAGAASSASSPHEKEGSFMRAYSSLKRGESVRADISGGKEGKEGREKKDDMFFNECGTV